MLIAYLAGCIDSDGSIGIKKSTYHIRVRGDAKNATYSERIALHQTVNTVPELLKKTFGGNCHGRKPQTQNSKPSFVWQVTDLNAARAATALLPFLRIKKEQARILLELRETKNGKYRRAGHWFGLEFPEWREMELVDAEEAALIMGYRNIDSVGQAISNGTLLALPHTSGIIRKPRIPLLLVERLRDLRGSDGKAKISPPQLIEWKEKLWSEARELNKVGVNGTPIYHKTGPYQPTEVAN